MQFIPKTVLGLFDSSQKFFVIPVYQRAYSWEVAHWNTFLSDLREQVQGDNNYFYGNLLLETIRKDRQYEVIDGQQRLTTLTIFIRALLNIIASRITNGEIIDIDVTQKESIYFKNGGVIKLRPVEYDRAYYDTLIIDNNTNVNSSSVSQKRIKAGKDHFEKELSKETTESLIKILEKLESTEITCIELDGKKDSALMFELQNNRGKDLTNMEKLKSYFMYQIYVFSPQEEIENNVTYISDLFKTIYLIINDLKKINEDSVLIYHCQAYINGYTYRTIEDIKSTYKKSTDRVKWIKEFIVELSNTFSNIKKLETSTNPYLKDLTELESPVLIYPFIIKGYKYLSAQSKEFSDLANLLEILVFRYRLINSRADIYSRINQILQAFSGDTVQLAKSLKQKFNEENYWSDLRLRENLNGFMYDNSVITYLLWKYEESIQNRGYKTGTLKIVDEQIEHISPQTPTNGDPVESGYAIETSGTYSEEFQMKVLNSLGNLMLISKSHNCAIGNRPFVDKLASYIDNPLLNQQAEIKEFVEESSPVWDDKAIRRRHSKILSFSLNKWSFDSFVVETVKI